MESKQDDGFHRQVTKTKGTGFLRPSPALSGAAIVA